MIIPAAEQDVGKFMSQHIPLMPADSIGTPLQTPPLGKPGSRTHNLAMRDAAQPCPRSKCSIAPISGDLQQIWRSVVDDDAACCRNVQPLGKCRPLTRQSS